MTEEETTIASEVLSASLGGAISASILYPLEVLKTKIQAADGDEDSEEDSDESGDHDKGMIATATKLYQKEGISVFLRGMETSAFQSATEKALYFFAYTALKEGYSKFVRPGSKGDIGALPNLLLGCAAEWMHLPVSLPIDAWTTQIQTSTEAPMQILLTMLSSKNKASWYKGLSTYYVLCFKPALQYTVYEQVKKMVIKNRPNKTLSAAEAFLLGMVARTVATVLVFPCVRAKVLLQKQAAAAEQSPEEEEEENNGDDTTTTTKHKKNKGKELTMTKVLFQTLQKQGLAGLYQGLGPELTRGIFSAALMLMIKERIAGTVRGMLASRSSQQQLRR